MAKLIGGHKLDCCRECPRCCRITEARYDGAQLVSDRDRPDGIAEARQYTCLGCGNTYNADFEPRPDATSDDLLTVTDRRQWNARRVALMRGTLLGIPAPAVISAPGPGTRGAVAIGAGFYSLVGDLVDG